MASHSDDKRTNLITASAQSGVGKSNADLERIVNLAATGASPVGLSNADLRRLRAQPQRETHTSF
jgi:hypothetical protein